jgi:hypothetical protein
MGTSASNKGPNSNSPLVPPWADATPGVPLPAPEGQRFRGFRTEFGHAFAGDGVGSLRAAVGKYAREASGGSAVGPRRFGPTYTAGADLVGVIGEMRGGGTGEIAIGIDLSRLIGQPLDYAAQEVARALAPENADADQITAAIQEAMAEALPGVEIFDPPAISLDQIVQLLVEFFSRILFQEITNAAGDAWNRSPGAERTTRAEADLLELVRAVVDKHLSPRFAAGFSTLSRAQIVALERAAIAEVWREWESYE